MCRIILHGNVTDALKFLYPAYDLLENVSQDNGVSVTPFYLPSLSEAFLFLGLSQIKHLLQDNSSLTSLEVDKISFLGANHEDGLLP